MDEKLHHLAKAIAQ